MRAGYFISRIVLHLAPCLLCKFRDRKTKIFQSWKPSCQILLPLKRNYLFLHLIINLKVVATVTRHSLVHEVELVFKGNAMRRERMARNHSSLPVSALWLSLFPLTVTVRVRSEVCAPVTTPNGDVIGSWSTPVHHCTARWEDKMFNDLSFDHYGAMFLCLYCTSLIHWATG